MFESLGEKLNNAFKKFRNKGKLTEADIIDTIESSIGRYDIALLELADDNKIIERERESDSYCGQYEDGFRLGK